MRAGSKLTIDGWPGTVHKRSGDRVFVSWFTGEPARLPDGKVLGWAPSQMHDEWLPVDSPRLVPASHNSGLTEDA